MYCSFAASCNVRSWKAIGVFIGVLALATKLVIHGASTL